MSAVPGADHWQQIEALFYAALELEPPARPAFLDQACGSNLELRREVESLLDCSDQTLGFARQAVLEVARQQTGDSLPAGMRVGAYQLLGVLGEGGMGKVYLATRADELYKQEVAIKLMRHGSGPSRSMLLRFSSERQILANLNHPNIARLLDGGITADAMPYLVMEYVNGIPIDEYCRQNRLSIRDRLQLFRTVCTAVEYAHKNLVVHRDLKPGNILVTSEGVPKLLDFGIAKLLDPQAGELALTRPTERIMTPEYASPEQVRGTAVTTSTDVYALGVLLYELLAGRRPFQLDTKSPLEAMQIICEQDPEPPSRIITKDSQQAAPDAQRRLAGDLDNIVMMAMRKEPSRRYVSVAALSADVQAHLEGYPVHARTDTWSYRGGKFVRRHRVAVALAAAMAVALVAFSLGMAWLARRATQARVVAEQQRFTAQREAEFLTSIFQAATPEEARGQTITARDLLDRGVKRIDNELAAEPETQATMLESIGNAYYRLGDYDQAQPLLERASVLRARIGGTGNLSYATAALYLGTIYRLQGAYGRAEPLLRQAVAIREKILGPEAVPLIETLDALGECLYLEGRDAESESLLRRALALDQKQKVGRVSATRDYLALVLERRGDYPEALQLLREAVEIDRRDGGQDSPNAAISLHNLAGALIDTGDLTNAEVTERQAVAIRRHNSGSEHPELAYPLNNLGWILLAKGDWRQAEPVLHEALEIRRKKLGEKHPLFAASVSNWGRALEAKGDYAGAEDCYRRALQITEQAGGPQSWAVAKLLSNFGLLQLDRGDYAGAESYARQALEIRRKLGGNENPEVATSLIEVAVAREFQRDPASAEPLLREALDIRKKKFSAGHSDIIAAQVRLGEALTDEGKAHEAEPLLREALKSAQNTPFALVPWQKAEAENALGACLAKLGRGAEAASLLQNSRSALQSYPEAAMRRRALEHVSEHASAH